MSSLAPLVLALLMSAPPDAAQIDRLVTDALKAWDVPGAAVVVVTPDGVIHLKGYGVRELGGKPVTPDTVFPLASCTKAFTTALVARLADEGRLMWDDPVRKHLADFRLSDPAADALVTLRDLGSHRTGLGPHDLFWYRSVWSQAEMVRRAGKLPLARPFRTEMQYQSVMYVALGQAAAKAGGKPWADLVRELLLDPLGMKGTTLTTTAAARHPDRASGHKPDADGKLVVVPWYEQPEANPAGSVNSSARDLAAWLRFQLAGGRHGETQLVTEAALRETQSPQTVVRLGEQARALSPDTHQISYGLGWVVQDYRGRLQVQHAGLIDGFRAHLTLLPKDGYAFAILANREGTRMNLALGNALTDLLLGLSAKDWNKHLLQAQADAEAASRVRARQAELARQRDPRPPAAPPEKLAGAYEEPAYGTVTVRAGKDGLVWEWGAWKVPLEHWMADMFRFQAPANPYLDGTLLQFVIDGGDVRAFRLAGPSDSLQAAQVLDQRLHLLLADLRLVVLGHLRPRVLTVRVPDVGREPLRRVGRVGTHRGQVRSHPLPFGPGGRRPDRAAHRVAPDAALVGEQRLARRRRPRRCAALADLRGRGRGRLLLLAPAPERERQGGHEYRRDARECACRHAGPRCDELKMRPPAVRMPPDAGSVTRSALER